MPRGKISYGSICSACTILTGRLRKLTECTAPKPWNWRPPPPTLRALFSNADYAWWDSGAEECWWAEYQALVIQMGSPHAYFKFSWSQVNHLSKRHPEMRIDDVPELTLPIIKPNRDYFCQYCDKVCIFDMLWFLRRYLVYIVNHFPSAFLIRQSSTFFFCRYIRVPARGKPTYWKITLVQNCPPASVNCVQLLLVSPTPC